MVWKLSLNLNLGILEFFESFPKNNQNNNIKANTRQSSGGGSDLAAYLETTGGRLERGSISKRGSVNEAIRKLDMFKDLEGG